MLKKFYILAILLNAANAYAIEATTASKIADGVALERIQAYAASSTKAKKVGIVEPGTELIEFKTFMKTKPGLALMEDNSWDKSIPFDRGAYIHIWEYIGDGFSKIVINDVRYNAKIARSKTECKGFGVSPKYCWAKVIEEPEYYEWKQVALSQDGQKFWILNRTVDGSGILVVKDKGIEKTRIVNTKYVEKPKEETTETLEEAENNKLLLDPDLKTNSKNDNSLEGTVAKNLLLTPEERQKARKEAKEKLKALNAKESADENTAPAEIPQDEVFKQQGLEALQAPVDENSTKATMTTINTQTQAPATKLNLEPNKPLTLPPVE